MKHFTQRQIDAIINSLTMTNRTKALRAAGYGGKKPKPGEILGPLVKKLKPLLEAKRSDR